MTMLTLAPDPDLGRMRIVVQDGAGGALTRNGVTVRGGEALTGDAIVDDYEAPFGVDLVYELDDSGAVTGRLDVTSAWLTSATDPGMPVTVRDQDPRTYTAPGRTYQPLGSNWPVAVHTVRSVHEGTLDLLADHAQSNQLRDLIADGTPLLLRTPAGCTVDDMWLWPGVIDRTRQGPATNPLWLWSMQYQRVQDPSGSVTIDPSNAWAAVTATHPTWDELVASHPTWFDVALTPHPHP